MTVINDEPKKSLSVVNDALEIGVEGMVGEYAAFQLEDGGTYTGVVTFEHCVKPGLWVAVKAESGADRTTLATTTAAAAGTFFVLKQGCRKIRARLSTATAGTLIVYGYPGS